MWKTVLYPNNIKHFEYNGSISYKLNKLRPETWSNDIIGLPLLQEVTSLVVVL